MIEGPERAGDGPRRRPEADRGQDGEHRDEHARAPREPSQSRHRECRRPHASISTTLRRLAKDAARENPLPGTGASTKFLGSCKPAQLRLTISGSNEDYAAPTFEIQ
jgi:hypothetical protein